MSNKPLTALKREQMFQAWCEEQKVRHVVKLCSVSRNAVVKYRKVDNYDARFEEIQRQARERVDKTEAEHMADTMEKLDRLECVYFDSLKGLKECEHCGKDVEIPKLIPKFKDFEGIFRFREFIRGKPGARMDRGKELEQLPDLEILAMLKRTSQDFEGMLRAHRKLLKTGKQRKSVDAIILALTG